MMRAGGLQSITREELEFFDVETATWKAFE